MKKENKRHDINIMKTKKNNKKDAHKAYSRVNGPQECDNTNGSNNKWT